MYSIFKIYRSVREEIKNNQKRGGNVGVLIQIEKELKDCIDDFVEFLEQKELLEEDRKILKIFMEKYYFDGRTEASIITKELDGINLESSSVRKRFATFCSNYDKERNA